MKNKFLFALMAVFALVACTPENYSVFEESPDERVAKVLKEYESILLGSENGWILTLETGTSGAYNHWVKFLPNNRIQMLFHHFIVLCNCSQVHELIPFYQHFIVGQKLFNLFVR